VLDGRKLGENLANDGRAIVVFPGEPIAVVASIAIAVSGMFGM
jgi:hypothetical protein